MLTCVMGTLAGATVKEGELREVGRQNQAPGLMLSGGTLKHPFRPAMPRRENHRKPSRLHEVAHSRVSAIVPGTARLDRRHGRPGRWHDGEWDER
jgi:hypothetical protein